MEGDSDQAYRGQDLVDPRVIRPRQTRRDRLQRQGEAQTKRQAAPELPVAVGAASATDRVWYQGGRAIEVQPKPWVGDFSQSGDCATLTGCDQQVVAVAKDAQLVPQTGPTAAMVTPSYLTVVTPVDDAILTAQTDMEISAALPYARGRCQEPLGEKIIVNDLYGVPLYKPAVGPIDPNIGTGAVAAKDVIARTGADPNFVYDQAKRHPEKASVFEMGFRPQDPGPMRYVCRVEDYCTIGGMCLAFSTEEELVAHWNTFHVAVAPQFTCQVAGCKAMFAADPGALDRYLYHVGQKMAEEDKNPRVRGERHTLEAVPEALSLRPNPFFKPPGTTFGVPRRTARVVAPPKCHPGADTGLSILNIRWAFRKLFEKKVRTDLAQHGAERERKRVRRDSRSDRPSKRVKLDLEHRRRSEQSESGRKRPVNVVGPLRRRRSCRSS